MKYKILIIVAIIASFSLGYYLGDYRVRCPSSNSYGTFVCSLLEFELRRKENAAFYAYLNEPPAIAAWALENLINDYQRHAANILSITGKPETEYKTHEMFAHARLFIVYSSLDMAEKAQLHLDRAISLSDGKDADELIKLVGYLDKAEEKMSQQGVAGYPPQGVGSPER